MIQKRSFDAVVIGTGCAGYNCADWLYDFGCKKIAIVTEGKKVGTSRNTGSDKQTYYKMSLAGNAGDSVKEMAETLFSGGAMDGNLALVEAANSVRSFLKLANLGVRFPTNEYGEYVGYKTDHDPYQRATSIGPYTSKKMTEVLERSVLSKGIEILDHFQVVKILKDGERTVGLVAIDLSTIEEPAYLVIEAPNVVLATGGPAGIYADSVYPEGHTGSSGLALEAGAEFVNLSEWQYGLASTDFRWNVSGTYQQVLPRYISVDENGVEREFLTEHYVDPAEMLRNVFLKGYEWPFDVRKIFGSSCIDLLVYLETVVKGRKVYLDFTREPSGLENGFSGLDEITYNYLKQSEALIPLPIRRLEKMNPGAVSLYRDHGIDIAKEPLRIAVCAQHNNGGVRVDSYYRTNIRGLYCIGEAAGVFGVFRPGGSALNSTQVGGLRVARRIAYFADTERSERFGEIAAEAVRALEKMVRRTHGAKSTIIQNRRTYQSQMSKNFSFLRNVEDMKKGCTVVHGFVRNFFQDNRWEKPFEIPQLFKNYDIAVMCEAVSKAFLETAKRYGSRGSAYVMNGDDVMKRDPVPENEIGRSHVLVLKKTDGKITVGEQPVKPIPERDLWFERVWGEYRNLIEKR